MDFNPQEIDPLKLYKFLISVITPRPIAWVSTISNDGIPNLAPFSFSTAVGSNPPSHLFCPVNRSNGSKKHTLLNIEANGEYVVAVVPFGLRDQMNITAADHELEVNEFEKSKLTERPSKLIKAPCIAESPINMECKVIQVVKLAEGASAGNIVIGRIVAIHVDDSVMDFENFTADPNKLDTIGRLGGPDYCRTDNRFVLPRVAP